MTQISGFDATGRRTVYISISETGITHMDLVGVHDLLIRPLIHRGVVGRA